MYPSTASTNRIEKSFTDDSGVSTSGAHAEVQHGKNEIGTNPAARLVGMPFWKRALDVCLVVLGAPVWLFVMFLIALGVKLASSGPVFFRQERIGCAGRRFLCLKFRSMRCDASSDIHQQHLANLMNSDQPMEKLDAANDPRLIPFGDILRASGLDELPQIFNVLRGEMSLVGPRPCTVYEAEGYSSWQKERFNVLPGLTGLWQVTGKNKTTFEQMIRLDIQYGRQLSLKQDLWIIMKTFNVLLGQLGHAAKGRLDKSSVQFSNRRTTNEESRQEG